ncbi:MAG: ferredoxin [Candidatus Melainabacteria bacterium GWA2_34_9]|nr:MAG: ferredoxin [Candidatus Melainabacteria bacterium GWA2_34_9]
METLNIVDQKVNININGDNVSVSKGTTILEAANQSGINIPTLCHLKKCTPTGACRICVVEVEGARTLVASCTNPVAEGMKIKTHSNRVIDARKTILELMIANHPMDCLKCDRSGFCSLQSLSEEYGITEVPYQGKKRHNPIDLSSPSIVRDADKCILCGKCVKVCEQIQTVNAIEFTKRGFESVVAPSFDCSLGESNCINCGQCIMVCPTGALTEKGAIEDVRAALKDPAKVVVVQPAPAIRVTIGEAMGMEPGAISTGKMVTALKKLGFNQVFDTDFAADLTIMEEGSELVHRVTNNGVLPLMSSCSPGWIKFVEHFYPSLIPNLSTCKSPHQMLGAVIKSYWAKKAGVDPKDIYVVSIMPCTAKKFEAQRPELENDGLRDVDAVLTTRELTKLFKTSGINFSKLEETDFDSPLGLASGAGDIFAASGGVMEAALRSAYFLITGEELENIDFTGVRGLDGVKEATVNVKGLDVKIAVASSLGQARKLMDKVVSGEADYHFIEIMTCAGGCIAGGGQPLNTDIDRIKARLKSIYAIDAKKELRKSHKNADVQKLYEEFLGKPLSEVSHKLLHTHYHQRELS